MNRTKGNIVQSRNLKLVFICGMVSAISFAAGVFYSRMSARTVYSEDYLKSGRAKTLQEAQDILRAPAGIYCDLSIQVLVPPDDNGAETISISGFDFVRRADSRAHVDGGCKNYTWLSVFGACYIVVDENEQIVYREIFQVAPVSLHDRFFSWLHTRF